MKRRTRSGASSRFAAAGLAAALLLATGATGVVNGQTPRRNQGSRGARGPRVQVGNLRLNLRGSVLADVKLTTPPPPRGGVVNVVFTWGTVTETVRVTGVASVTTVRVASTRTPFPCNRPLEVTARVAEAAGDGDGTAGSTTTARLNRPCSRATGTGTPDLKVVSIERVSVAGEIPGLKAPPHTPIRLRIRIVNDSDFDMPENEQGGTPFEVQVTPGGARAQTIRTAIHGGPTPAARLNNSVLLFFNVALPCGRETEVTAYVDRTRRITETDETNNRLTVKIPGNSCDGRL